LFDTHKNPESNVVNAAAPFADGYPMLLLAEASVDDINRRVGKPDKAHGKITPSSFRPNVVIAGTDRAWDEVLLPPPNLPSLSLLIHVWPLW
jgi:uncharacterized protein YcbX